MAKLGRKPDEEFIRFEKQFSKKIRSMSHMKLKTLNAKLWKITKAKYGGHREPKSEVVERGFTDQELQKFLAVVDDPEDRLAFVMMAALGLRINELLNLKGENLIGDTLRITSAKGSYISTLKLPSSLLAAIPAKGPDERIFNLCSNSLRRHFREYREKAGLNDIYLLTPPCGVRMKRNRRFRLSTHSLRHYAISRAYALCRDPDLTRRLARHRDQKTTQTYLVGSRKAEVEVIVGSIMDKLEGHLQKAEEPKWKEDLKRSRAEQEKRSAELEHQALEGLEMAYNECKDPEAYLTQAIEEWLADPISKGDRRILGTIAFLMREHPERQDDDLVIHVPNEAGGLMSSLFWEIAKKREIPSISL